MTRKALHSALLEVGLYFEKGWSVDRIARFTYRLRRRRIHADDPAERTSMVAPGLQNEQRTVGYAIEQTPVDSRVAINVAPSRTTTDPTEDERLVARVRAGLSRRIAADQRSAMGFACAVCGEPATGWTRIDSIADGKPVIDGYATCLAHRSPEAVEQLLVTRSG